MGYVSDCVGDEVCHELTHKGKTYKVRPVTQAVKAEFEKKLWAKARECAKDMRECMTTEEYAAHLKKLNDDYLQGAYSFEGEVGQKTLVSNAGVLSLASLLFGLDEMATMKLLGEAKEDVVALLKVICQESFPDVAQTGEASPNG